MPSVCLPRAGARPEPPQINNSWWWLKRNSERVFNDAKTTHSHNTEVTLMWNRWRSTLFTWYPNVIAIGPAGSWRFSVRTIIFYGLSVVLWLSYFYAFAVGA